MKKALDRIAKYYKLALVAAYNFIFRIFYKKKSITKAAKNILIISDNFDKVSTDLSESIKNIKNMQASDNIFVINLGNIVELKHNQNITKASFTDMNLCGKITNKNLQDLLKQEYKFCIYNIYNTTTLGEHLLRKINVRYFINIGKKDNLKIASIEVKNNLNSASFADKIDYTFGLIKNL